MSRGKIKTIMSILNSMPINYTAEFAKVAERDENLCLYCVLRELCGKKVIYKYAPAL
jgi:hypothetical protein